MGDAHFYPPDHDPPSPDEDVNETYRRAWNEAIRAALQKLGPEDYVAYMAICKLMID